VRPHLLEEGPSVAIVTAVAIPIPIPIPIAIAIPIANPKAVPIPVAISIGRCHLARGHELPLRGREHALQPHY
jgi:hypothetical protein